jgi:hypothetical protein
MPIYQTGGYQVRPSGVNKVKQAIQEFVAYVQANEPGTHMYLAWQQQDDPTRSSSRTLPLRLVTDSQKRSGASKRFIRRKWLGKRSCSPITR